MAEVGSFDFAGDTYDLLIRWVYPDVIEGQFEAGTTIIMVTHDQALADHAHRIIRLFDGRILQEAAA